MFPIRYNEDLWVHGEGPRDNNNSMKEGQRQAFLGSRVRGRRHSQLFRPGKKRGALAHKEEEKSLYVGKKKEKQSQREESERVLALRTPPGRDTSKKSHNGGKEGVTVPRLIPSTRKNKILESKKMRNGRNFQMEGKSYNSGYAWGKGVSSSKQDSQYERGPLGGGKQTGGIDKGKENDSSDGKASSSLAVEEKKVLSLDIKNLHVLGSASLTGGRIRNSFNTFYLERSSLPFRVASTESLPGSPEGSRAVRVGSVRLRGHVAVRKVPKLV